MDSSSAPPFQRWGADLCGCKVSDIALELFFINRLYDGAGIILARDICCIACGNIAVELRKGIIAGRPDRRNDKYNFLFCVSIHFRHNGQFADLRHSGYPLSFSFFYIIEHAFVFVKGKQKILQKSFSFVKSRRHSDRSACGSGYSLTRICSIWPIYRSWKSRWG